ncbi:DNA binding protein [Arthrobacter phage Noely]|uniref:DNA binding protein n=1 Tax=Arthrobacter phage Noely TaxID=2419964 RepID=A0A3G2KAK8_9CAUD|nr:DNA binding protein [Arthrobacter phage Noely]AYN55959.1 DNA binding protein [Arthrobacter phage Noely]
MRARPVYVSIADAANILGVSPRTVKRYVNDGHLDAGELPHGQVRLSRVQVIGLVRQTPRNPA